MRVLKVANTSVAVSSEQESRWPELAAASLEAVSQGVREVPTVWFRTDEGVVGSIPVSDSAEVGFADEEHPVGFLGAITHFGPEAEPTH